MTASTTMTATIKAVCIHSFGGPDVLHLEEVASPEPKANEMLVRVHAAGVNPVDWKIREGYLGKFPLPAILGRDFSGVVEAVGPGVKEFHIGDAVLGEAAPGSGSYAEYTLAQPSQRPENRMPWIMSRPPRCRLLRSPLGRPFLTPLTCVAARKC